MRLNNSSIYFPLYFFPNMPRFKQGLLTDLDNKYILSRKYFISTSEVRIEIR
jgi:hypothetical protein